MTCSATPVPTQVLKEYSNPSFLTHPMNNLVDHDGYEEFRNFSRVVEPMHHAKRSLFKKTIKKKKTSPIWAPKKKITKPAGVIVVDQLIPGPGVGTFAGVGGIKKVVGPLIKVKGKKGLTKLGPKGLAGLTVASAPLVVTVKKPLSLKAAPKLVKAGPKVAGPLALGPLALGGKTLPAGAKVLKTAPLLAPAVLKKGPLVAGPLLLPLAGKTAKAKKLAIPAVLLKSQSPGGGSQRRGRSGSGGNRTRDCNRNDSSYSRNSSRGNQNDRDHKEGSSCAGEEDTRPNEDEVTTRAPTEEEKQAALETEAALEEARTAINQAQAAMQEALAAMRGAQLSDLSSLGRR